MAIHIDEQLLSLTDAARILPRRRGGKRPHVTTLYRWASRGLRGVQLETLKVGGTLCTSKEALQRFFERLDHRKIPNPKHASAPAEPSVEAELDRHGL